MKFIHLSDLHFHQHRSDNKEVLAVLKYVENHYPDHYHPFMHNNPFMELRDAHKLMRTIYSKVNVVLFGHKHVSKQWENVNGIDFIMAADNAPGKNYAREITIAKNRVSVKDIKID